MEIDSVTGSGIELDQIGVDIQGRPWEEGFDGSIQSSNLPDCRRPLKVIFHSFFIYFLRFSGRGDS